jgi:hypothetical protein
MTYRPRGTCRVCGRAFHGSWQGDVLIIGGHTVEKRICDGVGLPSADVRVRQGARPALR